MKRKDAELALKDAQIADLRQKMDDMSHEFGEMLKAYILYIYIYIYIYVYVYIYIYRHIGIYI